MASKLGGILQLSMWLTAAKSEIRGKTGLAPSHQQENVEPGTLAATPPFREPSFRCRERMCRARPPLLIDVELAPGHGYRAAGSSGTGPPYVWRTLTKWRGLRISESAVSE